MPAVRSTTEFAPPVDSVVDAPYAGFMNLQVPAGLEARPTRLAAEAGRTTEEEL